MAYFQLGGQDITLKGGSQRIGPDGGADIRLPSGEPTAIAVVTVNADQSVIIQRGGPEATVRINGVALGAEPSPLIHGDRVEIGGHELRFGDAKQTGSTQFLSSSAISDAIRSRATAPARPTSATGGRLVSLVDGREYAVPNTGLTIGRDPSADIVVAATEVSRKHVSIAPSDEGYMLTDLSTNGVWVNTTRVSQQQLLGRGDVIKLGNEEFRFYADTVKAAPSAASPAAQAPAPRPATPTSSPIAPSLASTLMVPTLQKAAPPAPPAVSPPTKPPAPPAPPVASMPPVPVPAAAPRASSLPVAPPLAAPRSSASIRPPLAVLEILNEGPDKGKKIDVHGPLTHIGRGQHNDLVLGSESASDSHAKLQKREDGWYIVDVDSTNGTYVGGRRVKGEQLLTGAPDLRFGDVKVAFRPGAVTADTDKGTRAIAGVSVEEARRIAARKPAKASPAPAPAEPEPKGGVPAWTWIVAVLVAAAAASYFLLGT